MQNIRKHNEVKGFLSFYRCCDTPTEQMSALFVHKICELPGQSPINSHFQRKWDWFQHLWMEESSPPSPLQDLTHPSFCLPIHARNVNSLAALKAPCTFLFISPADLLKFSLSTDIWIVEIGGPFCPGSSAVIGSARLSNGGRCRWTPFSTDIASCATYLFPSPKGSCHLTYARCCYIAASFSSLTFTHSAWLPPPSPSNNIFIHS